MSFHEHSTALINFSFFFPDVWPWMYYWSVRMYYCITALRSSVLPAYGCEIILQILISFWFFAFFLLLFCCRCCLVRFFPRPRDWMDKIKHVCTLHPNETSAWHPEKFVRNRSDTFVLLVYFGHVISSVFEDIFLYEFVSWLWLFLLLSPSVFYTHSLGLIFLNTVS